MTRLWRMVDLSLFFFAASARQAHAEASRIPRFGGGFESKTTSNDLRSTTIGGSVTATAMVVPMPLELASALNRCLERTIPSCRPHEGRFGDGIGLG